MECATLTRSLFLALFLLLPAMPAMAQNDANLPEMMTYDPTFTGGLNQEAERIRDLQRESLGDKGYITPTAVNISIVHPAYMDENQFGIQMAVPDVVSGCYTLTPLEYEAKFAQPDSLNIRVKHYRRIAPQGANARCDTRNKMATALMVLDKKDLRARGTKEINFSTEAARDTYRIVLGDNRLELIPQSMMVFKAPGLTGELKDRLVYTFASSKMVALQVPMAKPGEDLSEEINGFARSRALTPANADAPTSWAGNGAATYYFYDDGGHVVAQIAEKGYAELGKITVSRPYDGPDGRTEAPVTLSVFVTRPGTQL